MGGKNKERARAMRRQRDSLKAAARKRMTPRRPAPSSTPQSGVPQISSAIFPDDQYLFWMAHGVNYLLSDYTDGLWSPLFEGIYEGNVPSQDDIGLRVMEKYRGVKEWPLEAKAALAWVVTERSVMYIYYREILRRLHSAFPDAEDLEERMRLPHNPVVWKVMSFLKDNLLKVRGMR